MSDIDNIIAQLQRFSWPDYAVFIAMFVLCILIGIYFGFMKKSMGESDYLMGGRNMLVLPIALSLVASFVSGITLLGLPTEIYSYGIQYIYVAFGVIAMGFVMGIFFLPVFHNLSITSTYEYLESRFDRRLRMFGSLMFTIMNIGYLPIVIYVPALAFNQVTGVAVHTITPIVCIICVFYTSLGGLKAVVWTDVVQTVSMVGALILVAFKGSVDIGGASKVFQEAWDTNRIEMPDLSINPTVRHTLWSQLIGGVFYWTQTNAVSQNMIQRYLALPSLSAARKALVCFCVGVLVLMALCSYNGLLIYATYKDCDPLTTKLAKARDQLLPLFVMRTLGDLPGLTGLFIAGVFSAALSSLSTCLNSMSAVVLEDFVKPFVGRPLSEAAINWIMRSVVVLVGTLCVFLVYVVEHMGTVLQLTMSLEAITNGPLFGIFTIGIFMPWINGNSSLIGGIMGVIGMSWISLNAQWAVASGAVKYQTKPLTVEHCDYRFESVFVSPINSTLIKETAGDIFPLYRISYMWYTSLGAVLTIIIAIICTCIFGGNDPNKIDSCLLTPCIRKYFHYSEDDLKPKELTSSMNMNCIKGHGLDDDDVFSNISRISCGLQNSLNSTCNSDSECSGPISVRHMIQHYNNQFRQSEANQINLKSSTFKINSARRYHHPSQYLLAATRSSYCGLNNYGSPVNCNQFADQIEDDNHNNICCKNCTSCTCCRNRSHRNSTNTKMLSSTSSSYLLLPPNENEQTPNNNFKTNYNNTIGYSTRSSSTSCNKINANDTRILAVENCSNINDDAGDDSNNLSILNDFCAEQKDSSNDLLNKHNSHNVVAKQKNRLLSTDSIEQANCCQQQATETSYQSKTTIAKTSSGVRIIVDILFDQEQCANATNIVGSRVETDIPQSRILNEFQQQVMAVNADTAINCYQSM